MAGRLGFEPRYTESKSAVLPLDDLPILVVVEGNDPSTPVLSGLCSTSELNDCNWRPVSFSAGPVCFGNSLRQSTPLKDLYTATGQRRMYLVLGEGFEPPVFTLREQIYSLSRNHRLRRPSLICYTSRFGVNVSGIATTRAEAVVSRSNILCGAANTQ